VDAVDAAGTTGLEPGEYRLKIALVDAQGVAHDGAARFVVAAPGPRIRG
jgi:hypothetical protein